MALDVKTGRWNANDDGTYYFRQIGNTFLMYGHSNEQGKDKTHLWTNVGTGNINEQSGEIVLTWGDVPLGQWEHNGGVTTLQIDPTDTNVITWKQGVFFLEKEKQKWTFHVD